LRGAITLLRMRFSEAFALWAAAFRPFIIFPCLTEMLCRGKMPYLVEVVSSPFPLSTGLSLVSSGAKRRGLADA